MFEIRFLAVFKVVQGPLQLFPGIVLVKECLQVCWEFPVQLDLQCINYILSCLPVSNHIAN